MYLNWQKKHPDGVLHAPKKKGDAGYDLSVIQPEFVFRNGIAEIRTGIAVEIPPGFVGLIRERSSLARKGLTVTGGVIDSSYRGEIIVVCSYRQPYEFATPSLEFAPGDRFAQLLIVSIPDSLTLQEVNQLEETERGEQGFGSTGN